MTLFDSKTIAKQTCLVAALTLATAVPSAAERCMLDVVDSSDATGAELRYVSDSTYTQAILVSYHAYDDGTTVTIAGVGLCEEGGVSRCIGLVGEGLFPGEERNYWFTEILRNGDQVRVTTSGFEDAEMTRPEPDSVYVDVYSVRRCSDS